MTLTFSARNNPGTRNTIDRHALWGRTPARVGSVSLVFCGRGAPSAKYLVDWLYGAKSKILRAGLELTFFLAAFISSSFSSFASTSVVVQHENEVGLQEAGIVHHPTPFALCLQLYYPPRAVHTAVCHLYFTNKWPSHSRSINWRKQMHNGRERLAKLDYRSGHGPRKKSARGKEGRDLLGNNESQARWISLNSGPGSAKQRNALSLDRRSIEDSRMYRSGSNLRLRAAYQHAIRAQGVQP